MSARYRIDLENGYASFSVMEAEKAWDFYRNRDDAVRICLCSNIHDEGVVLEGRPIVVDLMEKDGDTNEVTQWV